MKLIRNIALTSFLAVAAFSAVTFTSCKKDDSTGCPTGYTGAKCDSTYSMKYLGLYNVTETANGAANPPAFSCTITASSTTPTTGIVISNFGNSGVNVTASVDNNGNITVPTTPITATKNTSGNGVMTGNTITLNYTISGSSTQYQDIMIRQ